MRLRSYHTSGVDAADYWHYDKSVEISFDLAKRALILQHRGLDFADACIVFAGLHATARDDRRDYGEPRFITAGYLKDRLVVLVWTPRDNTRRIISMRYAHVKEAKLWRRNMDRSG
jgi:uncharacterized DUF497 family protein